MILVVAETPASSPTRTTFLWDCESYAAIESASDQCSFTIPRTTSDRNFFRIDVGIGQSVQNIENAAYTLRPRCHCAVGCQVGVKLEELALATTTLIVLRSDLIVIVSDDDHARRSRNGQSPEGDDGWVWSSSIQRISNRGCKRYGFAMYRDCDCQVAT